MLGKVTFGIILLSFLYAAATGNTAALAAAVWEGAGESVTLTLSLAGTVCLWSGILRVLSDAGVCRRLSKLLSPILRPVFPDAFGTGRGRDEICACLSANILGIGNAATPLGLSAMKKMTRPPSAPDTATPDMISLAVLCTSSFCLFPSTVVALRTAAGSANPTAILPAVWAVSAAGAVLSLLLCGICARMGRRQKVQGGRIAKAEGGVSL